MTIPKPGYPAEMHRAELVELVREVMGEVRAATPGDTTNRLRLSPGVRSLRVWFILEGRRTLGEFIVPLPEFVVDALEDRTVNPYNRLEALLETTTFVPATMVPATPWLHDGTGACRCASCKPTTTPEPT